MLFDQSQKNLEEFLDGSSDITKQQQTAELEFELNVQNDTGNIQGTIPNEMYVFLLDFHEITLQNITNPNGC